MQLVTIHGSKGLEYPVVYLPYALGPLPAGPGRPAVPRGRDDGAHRCIDVGSGGPQWSDHLARARPEEDGESLRLLYVAMTRARSQVVAWWAPAPRNTPASPLHRMLFGRAPGESAVPREVPVPSEDDVVTAARRVVATRVARNRRRPCPSSSRTAACPRTTGRWPCAGSPAASTRPGGGRRTPRSAPRPPTRRSGVSAASRRRRRSRTSRSWSRRLASTTESRQARPAGSSSTDRSVPSPMADLPVGATFGSLVHAVLEHADPDADDFRAELLGHVHEQLVRWPVAARPRGTRRRAGAGVRHPARAAGRWRDAARHPAAGPAARRWSSSCRWPAATCGATRRQRSPSATWHRCCARTCRRATRCCPTPTRCRCRRWASRTCAATSPARSTWCCGCRTGRRAATSSWTTRPTGSAATRARAGRR